METIARMIVGLGGGMAFGGVLVWLDGGRYIWWLTAGERLWLGVLAWLVGGFVAWLGWCWAEAEGKR